MFPKIGNFSNSAYYSKPSSQIFKGEPKLYPHYGKVYSLPKPYYSQYPNPVSNERCYYLEKNEGIKEKALERKLLYAKNRQILIEKEKIRDEVLKLYNIKISNSELKRLSYEQLLTKVVKIHQKFKENTAALIIQESWKNYILRKDPNYMKRIQLARRLAKIKTRKFNKEEAAVVIQRIYRGFKVRQEFKMVWGRYRINKNIDYFEEVKNKLKNDNAKIIWKYWLVYRQKKREKESEKEKEIRRLEKQKEREQAEELKRLQARNTIKAQKPNPVLEAKLKKSNTMLKSPKKK